MVASLPARRSLCSRCRPSPDHRRWRVAGVMPAVLLLALRVAQKTRARERAASPQLCPPHLASAGLSWSARPSARPERPSDDPLSWDARISSSPRSTVRRRFAGTDAPALSRRRRAGKRACDAKAARQEDRNVFLEEPPGLPLGSESTRATASVRMSRQRATESTTSSLREVGEHA